MKKYPLKESALSFIFFIVLISLTYLGIHKTSGGAQIQQMDFLQRALRRATIQCYATEGMYPPNTEYLEDNYGVIINHKRYIVHYEVFAANIMPDISVFEKAGGE